MSAGGNPRRANGWKRDRQRRRWQSRGLPCYICGRPIDYSLPSTDPYGFVVDETIPLKHGGTMSMDNQGPAHRWCNRVKSTHSLAWARCKVHELIKQGAQPHRDVMTEQPVRSSGWF